MKLHLDTSFIIDWQRADARIAVPLEEILAQVHDASDPIVETEFFSAPIVGIEGVIFFRGIESVAERLDISSPVSRLASSWLAKLPLQERRRNFNDALITACASVHGATLVTADRQIASRYPIAVLEY